MDSPVAPPFRLGEWSIDPMHQRITRDGETVKLEPRTMRLLLCLAERGGAVVSADDLLDQVWPGVIVTPDSVYQAVAALRRLLGDDSKNPRYIVTVPKQGYRVVALVTAMLPLPEEPVTATVGDDRAQDYSPTIATHAPLARPSVHARMFAGVIALLVLGATAALMYRHLRDSPAIASPAPIPAARSVAVLPFLDLTESMGEEVFADGMTEELIDKLSKIPGLRVPSPTASFWFKDKQMTVAEIAAKLGVTFVLDGSVRASDSTLRVAARLVRADDGFVIWSETYDRPIADRLKIQDEIASDVQKAFRSTLDRPPAR
ncbi:MAG: winged helix-turn-helix domain-containing protein [Tahibacter sp.]